MSRTASKVALATDPTGLVPMKSMPSTMKTTKTPSATKTDYGGRNSDGDGEVVRRPKRQHKTQARPTRSSRDSACR